MFVCFRPVEKFLYISQEQPSPRHDFSTVVELTKEQEQILSRMNIEDILARVALAAFQLGKVIGRKGVSE